MKNQFSRYLLPVLLFTGVLLNPLILSAIFKFETETCQVISSQNISFTNKANKQDHFDLKLQLRLEMSEGPYSFPKVLVSFAESDKLIQSLELYFNKIPVNSFKNSLRTSVQKEEARPFSFQKTDDFFLSDFWGPLRSQHFIGLFLRQNYIQVRVTTVEGEIYQTRADRGVFLQASLASFRTLAWNCHKEATDGFLKESHDPTTPIVTVKKAAIYTNGYGLTTHGLLENYLPRGMPRIDFNPKKNVSEMAWEESRLKWVDLLDLLKQKQKIVESIDEMTKDKTIVKAREQFFILYSQLQDMWHANVLPLLGAEDIGLQGLIDTLNAKKEIIVRKLEDQEAYLGRLSISDWPTLTTHLDTTTNTLLDHKNQLDNFDKEKAEDEAEYEALQLQIVSFQELLRQYREWIRRIPRATNIDAQADEIPPEDIVATHQQELKRQQRLEIWGLVLGKVDEAIENVGRLSENAQAIGTAFAAYTQLAAKKAARHERLQNIQRTVHRINGSLYPVVIRDKFDQLNAFVKTETEKSMGDQPRSYDKEVGFLREKIRVYYKILDEKVTFSPLIELILCGSQNYAPISGRSAGSNCLNIIDFLKADLDKSEYFHTLTPKELNEILSQVMVEGLDPWQHEFSKVTAVIETVKKLRAEALSNDSHKKNLIDGANAWLAIQIFRWRLRMAKTKKEEKQSFIFTEDFYLELRSYFHSHLLEALEVERQGLLAELADLEGQSKRHRERFFEQKALYDSSVKEVTDQYITPLYTDLDAARIGEADQLVIPIEDCFFPIPNIDSCVTTLEMAPDTILQQEKVDQDVSYQTVFIMLKSIEAAILNVRNSMRTLGDRIASYDQQKRNFISENNMDDLKKKRGRLQIELASLDETLLYLEQKISENKGELKQAEEAVGIELGKLEKFARDVEALKAKLQPHVDKLKPLCLQLKPIVDQGNFVDSKIFDLVTGNNKLHHSWHYFPVCDESLWQELSVPVP